MNLASLRYLVALNEQRHFGRAAAACHVTQPALSNALRALERELGTPIVKRGRTYAGLTPEGEQVLATAQRMLHEHTLLQQVLASGADTPSGVLSLGTVPTAMPVAARFAAQLQARHPGIRPVLRSLSSRAIEEGLDNLSLDLAWGFAERLAAPAGRFTLLAQYQEHYFLLRRRAGTVTGGLHLGAPMAWADAAQLPLCLLTPEMHNRHVVDAAFAEAGTAVMPAMETDSILTLVLSVLAGDLCSVLPGSLVGAVRSQGALEALPLMAPTLHTPVCLAHLSQARPSRVLQAALQLAGEPGWLQEAAAHSGALAA